MIDVPIAATGKGMPVHVPGTWRYRGDVGILIVRVPGVGQPPTLSLMINIERGKEVTIVDLKAVKRIA